MHSSHPQSPSPAPGTCLQQTRTPTPLQAATSELPNLQTRKQGTEKLSDCPDQPQQAAGLGLESRPRSHTPPSGQASWGWVSWAGGVSRDSPGVMKWAGSRGGCSLDLCWPSFKEVDQTGRQRLAVGLEGVWGGLEA